MANRILWVDDEIEHLRPHILFLKQKGFDVVGVSNGKDALTLVQQQQFDIVFLDEQMPGMDGLTTLTHLKDMHNNLPVVMITKSEEEEIMEEAIGAKIADYLIKPVNPNQILLTVKRVLDRRRIESEKSAQGYLRQFQQIAMRIDPDMSWANWVDVFRQLTRWHIDLQQSDPAMLEVLQDQIAEANKTFGKFIERHYEEWVNKEGEVEEHPVLSPNIFEKYVAPLVREKKPVLYLVIDCMRYDQWLLIEELLSRAFSIQTDYYASILPTATPYSRNALFSGLMPSEIKARYPELWQDDGEDEHSLNQHEHELLSHLVDRLKLEVKPKYEKVVNAESGAKVLSKVNEYAKHDLTGMVFNFVDTLVHTRTESDVIKEIVPDDSAFRSITRTWFEHSSLYQFLKRLAEEDVNIVITTDHGATRALRDSVVKGDRETSTNLRYKYGRNLGISKNEAIIVQKPERWKLPLTGGSNNYIIAKENYYFVYPTNYHKFQKRFNDTFLHGGASMEEVILPVATLKPKKGG